MRTLSQKKNFVKKEFKITNSKLHYNIIKTGNENEVDIPFENIEGDKLSNKTSNNALLVISIAFYRISISTLIAKFVTINVEPYAYIVWFVLASILFILYRNSRSEYWKIKLADNNYLFFHKNIPNEQEVNEFIETLISNRNEYLISTYSQIDKNLDYKSQLQNLKWLKAIDVITNENFDTKQKELKLMFTPKKNNIGFV